MKPQQSLKHSEGQLSVDGDALYLTGAVNFSSVARLLHQSRALPMDQVRELNCGGITYSDSAAVSLLLCLLQDRDIRLQGVNDSLQGLLDLYGVMSFFNQKLSE